MRTDELLFRPKGPSVATNGDLYTRSWVLLLVDASARNGITPISKLRLHRLAYLTNCLSPLYRIRANDERIVKFKRGPFYPVLQWHLDRLVGQGLLRVTHIQHFSDDQGFWMNADYAITKNGVSVIDQLSLLDEIVALAGYLLEVAKAYAARKDASLDEVILGDLTYDDSRRATGAVIDFSFPKNNLSAQAARSFGTLFRDPALISSEDKVHLYMEYLDRAREAKH